MKVKVKTIYVDVDGYIFLHEKSRQERLNDLHGDFAEKYRKHLIEDFNRFAFNKFGREVYDIMDNCLGGYVNKRWTSWTVEEMAEMLDKENLFYEIDTTETYTLKF